MKLKKIFSEFAAAAIFAAGVFNFSSCTSSLNDEKDNNSDYVTISIKSSSDRSGDLSAISFAKVMVSGSGITAGKEPYAIAEVENGQARAVEVSNVPKGKNRIITAYALDSSKTKIGTYLIRTVADIEDNYQEISVGWDTTALGNVFYELSSINKDFGSISSSEISKIKAAIPEGVHPQMVDVSQIAIDYTDGSLKSDSSAYKLSESTVSLTCSTYDGFTIQVCDPCSSVKSGCSSGTSSLGGIAPGTWPVYLIKDGKIVTSKICSFKSGRETAVSFDKVTDKIILHAYNYTHIWCYSSDDDSINYTTSGKWPGDEMTADTTDGWYTYTINQTSAKVIFSKNGSGQSSNGETVTAGEWWYKSGSWSEEDPADYEKPVIESVTPDQTDTVTGTVSIIVRASDNKNLSKAQAYLSGTNLDSEILYKTVKFSNLQDTVTFDWDSSCYKNGSYTFRIKVLDEAGNVSEEKSFSLNTENANRLPSAVITGPGICALGKTTTYKGTNSSDPNGKIVSYKWTVSGGASIASGSDTDSTISVQFPSSAGSCSVNLTVTDDDGASVSAVKSVEVKKLTAPDFREETIYFAMTTRFYDGDSSNNVHCWDENASTPENDPAWRGDFKGLIEKLDYIKALGFSAVWITPVVENCSGLDYHGYHAMNFSKVDPRYESEDVDFQTLIDEVHARDMKLILDVVFNHVGNFGEATLAPMFEKDYTADLADINACLKLAPDSILDESYFDLDGDSQYAMRLKMMKNTDYENHDTHNYFHHFGFGNWDNFSVQFFQMAGDCVDLNTENPKVLKYIGDAYSKYIEMGVDAFRIDTGKHISRLEFNYYLNDRFKEAARNCGNDNFYMFTEICAKSSEVTYRGQVENLSPYFYTWKDEEDYGFTMDDEDQFEGVIIYPEANDVDNDHKDETLVLNDLSYWTRSTVSGGTATPVNALAVQKQGMATTNVRSNRPESSNHLLNGNNYHTPDYSDFSGLNVIDFPMHWNFDSASKAYGVRGDDKYYNDATWNVVYVDSHDYGPGSNFEQRYTGEAIDWAENISLMFTFRGIPCIYYGSEVQFQKGCIIDKGSVMALNETGRAYFGDYLEGSVTASDFGTYTADGIVKETLNNPLALHIQRMNKIRRAIPALQKGQYSTENCTAEGFAAFKRRYTDSANGIDSFALVSLSGGASFTNLPAGTYVDVITGDKQTISENGTVKAVCSGQGNARIYVLQNSTASAHGADGVIGTAGEWLK